VSKLNDLTRDLKGKPQYRAFKVEREAIDEEARTVSLAFSSETEYERWFGIEILSHDKESIRLGRMNDSAAFLVNHNTDDQVGVIEQVEVGSDQVGRALVRFGRSDRAEEIWQDILDGIRKHVSVGYIVHEMVLDKETKDGPSVYRVTDWEPFEASIVPVPADTTVGVGRSAEIEKTPGEEPVDKEIAVSDKIETKDTAPVVDVKAERASARKDEQTRIREITFLGDKHNQRDLASEFVNSERGVDEFRSAVLEKMGELKKVDASPEIGLTAKETTNFSFLRAIDALANPGDAAKQEAASFERECSDAMSGKMKRAAKGIMVPNEVLTRDMSVGTDSAGGYTVGTDHEPAAFIDLLRNKMMTLQMGAKELTGLVGDVAIPKLSAGHTTYWVAEDGAPTSSSPTLGQLALNPKTIGAYSDISRQLMLQGTPDAEAIVRYDIAASLALGIDLAALHGTGSSNQPTGLAATSGIGSVAGGTNGATPTWTNIVKLETEVAQDNADVGSCGYLTNAKVRGVLKQAFANSTGGDTPLWMNGNEPGFGMLNGYRSGVTNQVSSTLTKGTSSGVASAIFFGNWADMIIAMWGGLDLMVDPYSLSTTGQIRVVGFQSVDVGIRRAESFAAMLDALTA